MEVTIETGLRIYLAIPYTGNEEAAYQIATKVAAQLIQAGQLVFSPITHSHPLHLFGLAGDWAAWEAQDRSFIELWAQELWIIKAPGWRTSEGIKNEIRIAASIEMPIRGISMDAMEVDYL